MALELNAKRGDVMLLVGTRKGAFLMSSNASRREWDFSRPHLPGSDIFHMAYDPRNSGTVFAATNSIIWGAEIQRSHDLGTTVVNQQKWDGSGPERITAMESRR